MVRIYFFVRKKIPNTGDKASLDQCRQQQRCHRRVDQEYPKTQFFRKTEKIIQNAKTQKRLEICQNQRPEVSNSSGSVVSGWTKNTQQPYFLEKRKKIFQNAKTQKRREICQNQRYALRPEVSNPSGSVVSTMFCKAKSSKKNFFLRGDFRPLPNKNVQMLDHFFPLLFPKDSKSLKILYIRLRKVEAKRPLNGTSKVKKMWEKKKYFLRGNFRQFSNKNVHI